MVNANQYAQNLALLAQSESVDRSLKSYRDVLTGRKEGDLLTPVRNLENILIDPNADAASLVNASPVALEAEVELYHTRTQGAVETALTESADQLAQDYCASLNNAVGMMVHDVSSREGFDKFSPEAQKKIIESSIYVNLAPLLDSLDPNDRELAAAKAELKGLDNASEGEVYKRALNYLTRAGLSENAINYNNARDVFERGVKPQLVEMKSRAVVSRLITGDGQRYEVNPEAFKTEFGSKDNYKKIAFGIMQAARNRQ
ncbi:MAG: hypothetical protein KKH88_03580 [Nanoarchaeota archaeon]|nr:hypothetical protein [Nanoarchaeota archaeon]